MTSIKNGLRRLWAVAALVAVLGTSLSADAAWVYYAWGSWLNAPAAQPPPGAQAWGSCPHSSIWPMNEASVGVFLHRFTTNSLSHANLYWESGYPWSYTSPYSPAMVLSYQCKNSGGTINTDTYDWYYFGSSGYSPDKYCPIAYPIPHRARCKTATLE